MAETGLNQNWNRDYDPLTGKYVEPDSIGLKGGPSTYAYVFEDPIALTDSAGLATMVSVRCGPVLSGGVHCKVVATCSKSGQTQIFQIGGPAGANDWQKLWYGLIPPKADPNSNEPLQANETQYAVTCSGDNCDCKSLQCLQKSFADAKPPPYYALWQNSNTFAHSMLSQCSCSVNPFIFGQVKGEPAYSSAPMGAVGW